MDIFAKEFVAPSSWAPRASLLRTLETFNSEWFGMDAPLVPVDVFKVYAIGAMLKAGGYRSAANYISRLKEAHIEMGYPWSDQLALACRKTVASVTRGIAPGRQSAPLPLLQVHQLALGDNALFINGPVGPKNMVIGGSFFCAREIELSLALREHIEFDDSAQSVAWSLPCSKNDPTALGKSRSWGCVCDGAGSAPCPYHALRAQEDLLERLFGNRAARPGVPFFPTGSGAVVDKTAVVATIEAIGVQLGLDVSLPDGGKAFGGHSLRVTGAQWLAGLGVPIPTIQLLARWSSDVVLRYVADTPLTQLTAEYRRASGQEARPPTSAPGHQDLVARIASLQAQLDEHILETRRLEEQARAARAAAAGARSPGFVRLATKLSKCHVVGTEFLDVVPLCDWRTRCGWSFGGSKHELCARPPSRAQLCASCFGRDASCDTDTE